MITHNNEINFARAIQASQGESLEDAVWAMQTVLAYNKANGINQPPADLVLLTREQMLSRQYHGYDRPRGQADEE